MFWVTIGSNTNLHLTLIYIFSVVRKGGKEGRFHFFCKIVVYEKHLSVGVVDL